MSPESPTPARVETNLPNVAEPHGPATLSVGL